MTKQHCRRCRTEEHIPTFQFVKFDGELSYLCGDCWTLFRRWFHKGNQMRFNDDQPQVA